MWSMPSPASRDDRSGAGGARHSTGATTILWPIGQAGSLPLADDPIVPGIAGRQDTGPVGILGGLRLRDRELRLAHILLARLELRGIVVDRRQQAAKRNRAAGRDRRRIRRGRSRREDHAIKRRIPAIDLWVVRPGIGFGHDRVDRSGQPGRHRLVEILLGPCGVSLLFIGLGAFPVSIRTFRIEADRLVVLLDGAVVVALFGVGKPAISLVIRTLGRIEAVRLADILLGSGRVSLLFI